MTIVEVMVAATLLAGGIIGALTALDGSRKLNGTSERKEIAIHRGQQELERVRTIPFAQLELASAPATSADPTDARFHVSGGTHYDWDHSSAANPLEPLAISADPAANPDAIVSRRSWSDGRHSGTLDTFVTAVDPKLKRVTVAVKVGGGQQPRRPVVVSTLVSQAARTVTP
jgi:hypothetical protein